MTTAKEPKIYLGDMRCFIIIKLLRSNYLLFEELISLGPFPFCFNKYYILLIVDYVSKQVKTIASPINDANAILRFLKK